MGAGPSLESFWQANLGNDIAMLGLDVYNGSQAQLESFRNRTGISFPMLQKAANGSLFFSREDLIVVGADGVVRYVGHVASASSRQSAQEIVNALLVQKPMVAPIPNTVFFDRLVTLGDSRTAQITVTNIGNATLEITGLQANFGDLSGMFPVTVPVGESRNLQITLEPNMSGTLSGNITFITNADPFEITITPVTVQIPTPQITLLESTIDFGTFDAVQTIQKTFTIKNDGVGPLTINGIQSNLPTITFSPAMFTLQPDSSSTIAITYRNTTAGPFAGVIEILSDDLENPTLTLPISGTVQVLPANPKADFNADGKIDFSDFLAFAVAFGSTDSTYDISGNGTVDFPDFLTLAQSFGKSL